MGTPDWIADGLRPSQLTTDQDTKEAEGEWYARLDC